MEHRCHLRIPRRNSARRYTKQAIRSASRILGVRRHCYYLTSIRHILRVQSWVSFVLMVLSHKSGYQVHMVLTSRIGDVIDFSSTVPIFHVAVPNTRGTSYAVQHGCLETHPAGRIQVTPNKAFQRTKQSVTVFASAKTAPLCFAAELRR